MTDPGEKTGTFDSLDGLHIFYRSCQAEEERARFVIAHGIGEHSGRYDNVVNKLVPDGISVWAMEDVNRSLSRLKVPILMQLAGDDHLPDVNASKKFFERLSVDDKTLHVYDGLYHEIYNERDNLRSRSLEGLDMWMNLHL